MRRCLNCRKVIREEKRVGAKRKYCNDFCSKNFKKKKGNKKIKSRKCYYCERKSTAFIDTHPVCKNCFAQRRSGTGKRRWWKS